MRCIFLLSYPASTRLGKTSLISPISLRVISKRILGRVPFFAEPLRIASPSILSNVLSFIPFSLTNICNLATSFGFLKFKPFISGHFFLRLLIFIKAFFHSSTSLTLNLSPSRKFWIANPLPEPAPPARNMIWPYRLPLPTMISFSSNCWNSLRWKCSRNFKIIVIL